MNYGYIIDEPSDVYHASEAVSKTKLDVFKRQPRLYYRKYVEKSLKAHTESDALRLGKALHSLILEGPEGYKRDVAVSPEDAPNRPQERHRTAAKPSQATLDAFKYWDAFDDACKGKVIISAEEHALNLRVDESVFRHPLMRQLLDPNTGIPESTWRVKLQDFSVQCRPDWFNPMGCELTQGRPYIVDFKTCASLDEDDFGNFVRNFYSLGYYKQAAMYQSTVSEIFGPIQDFFFVAAEKREPFETRIYRPTLRAVGMGWEEVQADYSALSNCYRTNIWPEGPTDILPIDVPDWYAKREEQRALIKAAL